MTGRRPTLWVVASAPLAGGEVHERPERWRRLKPERETSRPRSATDSFRSKEAAMPYGSVAAATASGAAMASVTEAALASATVYVAGGNVGVDDGLASGRLGGGQ